MPVGDRLDRYELIAELGAGAFGVVYRARHLDMGREDAIKVPHNPALARHFVTEGRLVARLDHPNVVRVYAMNMAHDPPFIVYELVEGRSLRARMAEVGGPMDCHEVVEIARQVLAGLAAAHDLGIIHRDLKPENILLRHDGVAKISDFGLGVAVQQMSVLVSRSVSKGSAALASQLGVSRELSSAVGSSVAGTLAYMSPEQEDGLELDGRSDLFALGVLMYEAVTGVRPRGRFRDPADINHAVGTGLNDAIIAALDLERDDRHANATTMARVLLRRAESPSEVTQPAAGAQRVAQAVRIEVPASPPQPPVAHPWERRGEHLGQEIVGPAGIPLVWVPGGSFMMGSKDGPSKERPVHREELSGFWIGKTEVTVTQWRSVMESVPESNHLGDDHSVVDVSWNDCTEFCRRTGLELPTEAQWEYAARGAESLEYPWGNAWDPKRLCCSQNIGPGGRTFPVGSFPTGASWCGALDMAGNVCEWCADWYDYHYYRSSPAADPAGPDSGTTRVLRGGSWYDVAYNCRSASRGSTGPTTRDADVGFRLARSCR